MRVGGLALLMAALFSACSRPEPDEDRTGAGTSAPSVAPAQTQADKGAGAASAIPAAAPGDPDVVSRCLLEVRGRAYLDQPCRVIFAPGGSFTLNAAREGESLPDYFAYVSVEAEGVADGSWNETPGATHAHAPLGDLTRSGACWTNAEARVCAWR